MIENDYELKVQGSRGITLVRGEGVRLWDDTGREYIDCISSNGAAILGHAHPAIVSALSKQAAILSSVSSTFQHSPKSTLARRLVELAPKGLTRAFFTNSGTESVEAALKLARVATGRTKIVAAKRGFHGRSFGSMSVSFNPRSNQLFEPVLPEVDFVAYNKIESLEAKIDTSVAALVIELIQGEGGVHPADPLFVERAIGLCREKGVLLVIDEVQTGFGRTGRLFACDKFDVEPDIMCLAKGIAGGFPMGAMICRDGLEFPVGSHGSTFGGNPLACTVANAVLDVVTREGFLDEVDAKAATFRKNLTIPVRGCGLMLGIELKERARPYVDLLAKKGILALTAGKKVLRLLPPLTISRDDIISVTNVLGDVIGESLVSDGSLS